MKTLLKIATVATVFMLAGCATTPTTVNLVYAFDVGKAKALLVKGPNTIKGSALMRQRNGGVVTCAGYKAYLVPYTEYAAERMRHL